MLLLLSFKNFLLDLILGPCEWKYIVSLCSRNLTYLHDMNLFDPVKIEAPANAWCISSTQLSRAGMLLYGGLRKALKKTASLSNDISMHPDYRYDPFSVGLVRRRRKNLTSIRVSPHEADVWDLSQRYVRVLN